MFQPYELFVGLRYTRAKRRNHFISFISLVSILGIALGVTALITVTSVMNGFEKEMRERIVGASSHATVTGLSGAMDNWQPVADIALQHPEVLGPAPYVEGQVMLVHAGRSTGALIRGILPDQEGQVSEIADSLEQVESLDVALQPGEFGILLGADLASYLGAIAGDRVMVITPEATVTPMGFAPRVKRFTVTGVFRFGMFQFDRNLAVMHADDVHYPVHDCRGGSIQHHFYAGDARAGQTGGYCHLAYPGCIACQRAVYFCRAGHAHWCGGYCRRIDWRHSAGQQYRCRRAFYRAVHGACAQP